MGPYEHCSVLRMIEWRWGLEPMTLRDQTAKNLAEALDFSTRRDPVTLPAFTPDAARGLHEHRSTCPDRPAPRTRITHAQTYLTDRSSSGQMAAMDWPLKFGIFMAPFHPTGQNPTLALERDLDLIVHLDKLGFDEAWIGEHHSGGYEIIASPELFIATAAERTKHIQLGTGVVSLPYHHPFMTAQRIVLLDHLTRGRVMLGVRPGRAAVRRVHARHRPGRSSATAWRRRSRSSSSCSARDEPVTHETDWFTLRDARLHLALHPAPPRGGGRRHDLAVGPAGGRQARRARCCRSAPPRRPASTCSASTGRSWRSAAAEFGNVADRRNWRLVEPGPRRRDEGAGLQGRRVRPRRLHRVLPQGRRPADGPRGRRGPPRRAR